MQSVIFDFDDTLVQSGKYFAETTRKAAEILGLRMPSDHEIMEYGDDWNDFITKTWPGVPLDDYKRVYKKLAEEIKYQIIEGANDALSELSGNYVLYILSKRPREMLDLRIRQTGLRTGLFRGIYCNDDVKYKKPDPRTFDEIVEDSEKYGILEEEMMSVGDNPVDINASLGRDLKFVAVLTGDYEKSYFISMGLEEASILQSVVQLPGYLSKLKKSSVQV